jgi:hypothetical protein
MKTFVCTHCKNRVFFESTACVKCGHALGFHPETMTMVALQPALGGLYRRLDQPTSTAVQYCANAAHGACNWLCAKDDPTGFCRACDLNRTIPDISQPNNLKAWRDLEQAKKRLVYSLMRFELPFSNREVPKGPLAFDFLRHAPTGHLDGVITIDVTEADAVERERQRQLFGEPYRSLLGHLRHESGHYYWMVLVEGAGNLTQYRDKFGDEREDYQAAVNRHHASGPTPDWQAKFVSAYASAHPWEDWAESWAHYLHMVDALDTAEASGMEPRSAGFSFGSIWPFKASNVYRDVSFEALLERWIPLTVSMNSLSRSMGHDDFYPFVMPPPAIDKLAFVHKVVREATMNGVKSTSAESARVKV